MTKVTLGYQATPEQHARAIVEGRCVVHEVDLERVGDGWVKCPVSGGRAKAWTNGPEIVVEIEDDWGMHTVLLPIHSEV